MNKDTIVHCHTYTGRMIDLNHFTKEDIDLRDIAVSLTRQRRYAGHSAIPWSVTQHLLLCGAMANEAGVSENDMKAIVLHDVEETWVQDVIFPIKKNFMLGIYKSISHKISETVYDFFGCPMDNDTWHLVDCFDRAAYIIEAMHMIPGFVWDQNLFHPDVNALVTKLINDDFEIPKSLMEMSEEDQAQNLFEVLNVWAAEKVLGGNIVVDEEAMNNVG